MAGYKVEFSFWTPTGYTEYVDVTEDITERGLGEIRLTLDNNDYDVGRIKFNKLTLTMRNEHSAYSEAVNALSIFPNKRDQTLVRVSWDRNEYGSSCGNCYCGLTFLDQELEVFKGLLEDNSTRFDTEKQEIKFNILGIESIIGKVNTNYSSYVLGDDVETLIYKTLNQSSITQFFTVDAGNISVNFNFTPDAIASLEENTALETLDELLFLSGAVLFVENDTVYVRSRVVDPVSSYTFYSPSSDLGIESIHNISEYTTGEGKTFNKWVWKDSGLKAEFIDSQERYGVRKKEIESDLVTNPVTRQAILNALINEYGFPKIEFSLTVPAYTPIMELFFLNKVNIDYPADYLPVLSQEFSRYGQARYGQGRYARSVSSLFISVETDFKILNKIMRIKNETVTFKVREV